MYPAICFATVNITEFALSMYKKQTKEEDTKQKLSARKI